MGLRLKAICLSSLIAAGFSGVGATADSTYELDKLVVTGTRAPTLLRETNRSITLIDSEFIALFPQQELVDLLEYAPSVDIRKRGPFGIQSDVAIRGGTFEQTAILVDGVKVFDIQTGHHNMNLPVNLEDVKQIEILRGHGSSLYGPNALGGVINIITQNGKRNEFLITNHMGEHGLHQMGTAVSAANNTFQNRLSLTRGQSEGFRSNTDFEKYTLSWRTHFISNAGEFTVFTGLTKNEFGAGKFYHELLTDAWEKTSSGFVNTQWSRQFGGIAMKTKLFLRKSTDDFFYSRYDTTRPRNHHSTLVDGGEFHFSSSGGNLVNCGGIEIGQEVIESSNLGNHSRRRAGIFGDQTIMLSSLNVNYRIFGYYYSGWGWQLLPSGDIGYYLPFDSKLFFSVGKSFRVPTFTELHYDDILYNRGDPSLKCEEVWNYEAGFRVKKPKWEGEAAVFQREGSNFIDWVRRRGSSRWDAKNVAEIKTRGVECGASLFPRKINKGFPVTMLRLFYAYLDSERQLQGYESKYALDHLRQQVGCAFSLALPFNAYHTWNFKYEDRIGYEDHFLMDSKLGFRIQKCDIFADGTNLFNKEYREIGSAPMPGRWVRVGIAYRFN